MRPTLRRRMRHNGPRVGQPWKAEGLPLLFVAAMISTTYAQTPCTQPGPSDPACDDGNACTNDDCVPVVTGFFCMNTSNCHDGHFCNGSEAFAQTPWVVQGLPSAAASRGWISSVHPASSASNSVRGPVCRATTIQRSDRSSGAATRTRVPMKFASTGRASFPSTPIPATTTIPVQRAMFV